MVEDNVTRDYGTDAIAIEWRAHRCIHAAVCLQGLPEVFDVNRRPWILPENADADAIAQVVAQCPSGALHFRRLDGGAQEAPDAEPTLLTLPDGPLLVRGDIDVVDGDGNVFRHDTRLALCRCGASENKPFCDNSHRRIGFRAP
jgi:uncharacterized Fe-S cluster protein YjdI